MHDYAMLDDGDRVLAAVSGGIDSLALAWVLHGWRQKAPIDYSLEAVHVDMAPLEEDAGLVPGDRAARLAEILARLNLPLHILPARLRPAAGKTAAERHLCFRCARSRRNQLFDFARQRGCNKIALGHHRDDLIETFLLNLTCAGNISTMLPRQDLFDGRLTLIRPLAYLDKTEINAFAAGLGLSPLASVCPLGEETRRQDMRRLAAHIYRQIPGAKDHIFAALGNVRADYLLHPSGEDGSE